MLTSLFGDLTVQKPAPAAADAGPPADPPAFAATAMLESNAAEVNDRGQIVDRHLRDLFVTGSPAQAMREHFAGSRAELENAGKWIVLLDPSRIWASAVVKALSDASGQPIDRLHLRDQGTLRTLAMIERTSIVRRLDDTLKVFHADVRATGRENAEISLALMERANMTAVIVGPMQPHAIDAMLNTVWEATTQPTWRCPTLLFLLPPGAVWIANKIASIDWPPGLTVQLLNEPLTGASSVWNAVLGVWNRVKAERPLDLAAAPAAAPAADEFPIRVADFSLPPASEPTTLVPADFATTTSWPTGGPAPLDTQRAERTLAEMLRTDGLLACAIVDATSGLVLARETRDVLPVDLDVAAAAATQVLRAHRLAGRNLGMPEPLEELIVSAGGRQQILRVLGKRPELFLFTLLDRQRTNLALARFRVMEAEKSLA